jgi:hypothetical protein
MRNVQPSTDAPPAFCPTCGLEGEGATWVDRHGVRFAQYLCPAGHIWQTKWIKMRNAEKKVCQFCMEATI